MDRKRQIVTALVALLAVVSAVIGFSFTAGKKDPPAANNVELASAKEEQEQNACASAATYARLKEVAFEEALKLRKADPENLDTLATHSVVRMEDPVVQSRDEDLNVTVCSGRFILELPPGAERAFGGERRLTAEIEYAAQAAADGSGLVYEIRGAEQIVYKLANFDLNGRQYTPPEQPKVELAQAEAPGQPVPEADAVLAAPTEAEARAERERAQAIARAEADAADARQTRQRREAQVQRLAQLRRQQLESQQVRVARAQRQREAREAQAQLQREARAERQKETDRAKAQRLARAERTKAAEKARSERTERAEARPPGGNARPSFSCRSARTRSEKMVCSNGRLAARDRQMSSMFYSALADADPVTRRELRRTRDRFLAYRERCRSEECVAGAYEGRMREIADIAGAAE